MSGGVAAGDILAVHLVSLESARDCGAATISPDFGRLSGNRGNPNLQPPQDEHVWIWRFDGDGPPSPRKQPTARASALPIGRSTARSASLPHMAKFG